MAEKSENLDNILRDWAKDKVQKTIILENASKNIFEQSQSAVERD